MALVCLYIPRLPIRLAERARPSLAGQPVVMVTSPGFDGLVASASAPASAEGIVRGMAAADARRIAPNATFIPDNASHCLDELERVAAIIHGRATSVVEVGGRDHLFVALGTSPAGTADDPAHVASALRRIASAWLSGIEVRAGVASTRTQALAAARKARAFPIVLSTEAAEAEPALVDRSKATLSASARLSGTGIARQAAVDQLARQLGAVLSARAESFRHLTLNLETPNAPHVERLSRRPSADLSAALATSLPAEPLLAASAMTITLSGLGPDLAIARYCGGRAVRPTRFRSAPAVASPHPLPLLAAG